MMARERKLEIKKLKIFSFLVFKNLKFLESKKLQESLRIKNDSNLNNLKPLKSNSLCFYL